MSPKDLPIYEIERALLSEARSRGRLILQAPTGSGKSTQVPQMLLDNGLLGSGEVVILQPRRLPARMLAARVAEERGVRLGDEVGYQIRLDRTVSEKTRIRFVTEGVLLRQLLGDPSLRGVSAILFDEFHERHLYGDITLACALDLQETRRPDLKIIVMSATLDAGQLEKYLGSCAVIESSGRAYPVEIGYISKPVKFDDFPVWDVAAQEFERAASRQEGDALIFMPGAYEIGRTIQAVRDSSAGGGCVVLPLHGELAVADQDAALRSYGKRKVVVATNVAETSLTIDGVRLVIDSGLARIARYDPHRGINTLLVEKISRAAADQRAGRAGRTAPGRCVRLWTEREHGERPARELPEVKRLDLAEVVLTLKASGIPDPSAFRWLEAPEKASLRRAEELLQELGALEAGSGEITPTGRRMLSFPIHPRYSRMFLAAHELGCVRPIAYISALSQGRPVLRRGEGGEEREETLGEEADSDFFILLRAFQYAVKNNFASQACRRLGINALAAREAAQLAGQFLEIARDMKLDPRKEASDEAIRKSILAGFPDQVARRCEPGTLRCQLVHGRKGLLARESAVRRSELLVASEVREVRGKEGELQVLLTLATAIREEWLRELFPDGFQERHDVLYDPAQRRVVARNEVSFRDLVLRSEQTEHPPLERAASILAEQVIAGNCPLKNWDHAVEQWIIRVERLREWMPELGLPPLGPGERRDLIQQICYGAISYKEIKERPVWPAVKSWLASNQQEWLDRFVPEKMALPNGRKARVAYAASGSPVVAARIQDLYGVNESLFVADGRVSVVIQVLAPNHRPIQVTANLATFWKEAYPKIKQELQRKYPKHEWR